MKHTRRFFILLVFFLSILPLSAQESPPADDSMYVRFAYMIVDGPDLSVMTNGQLVHTGDERLVIPRLFVTDYIAMPVMTTGFGFRSADSGFDTGGLNITLDDPQPGHNYVVLILGSFDAGDTYSLIVDETDLLVGVDFAEEIAVLAVHNLTGAGPLLFEADGETSMSTTLDYGEYTLMHRPPEPGVYRVTVTDMADLEGEPVFELPGFTDIDGVFVLFALTGNYPGLLRRDYGFVSVPTYMLALDIVDAGTVETDDTIDMTLDIGQRHAFTLTLDETTTLDVMLVAVNMQETDAYLRIYDADGTLITENDELDFTDMGRDAGLTGLTLGPGTYTIEVASWRDVFAGEYTLVITPGG